MSALRRRWWWTVLLWPLLVGATLPDDALAPVRGLAIQHRGRYKPFDSFARETLKQVTGAVAWRGQDPVATVLSMAADPASWRDVPLIAVPFTPLREALGLGSKTTHVSLNALIASRALMKRLPPLVEKRRNGEQLTMLDNETWDAYERFVNLSQLFEQELALVPPAAPINSEGERRPERSRGTTAAVQREWLPVLAPAGHSEPQQAVIRNSWLAFMAAVRGGDPQTIAEDARRLAALLREANPSAYLPPWRLALEVAYNRAAPFRIAWMLYFAGALVLIFGVRGRNVSGVGFAVVVLGWLVHLGGIAARVILGGRPPVSNFFETMLWLPFVAVTLALVFERIYRVGYFALAASLLAGITLLLAEHVPLDSSITPVVAVLRSNLWLTVHVLTIVASYGALALATALAHIYGWLYLAKRLPARQAGGPSEGLSRLDALLYRAIQVGVVLLAGGIMLGAVWANASWGRYWGWDPKETWALITLLWFLAVLHGRFAGWIAGIGVALGTIGGFFLLLMTYYGVSFYLVGLHSYAGGNAKPLPALLIVYLVCEAAFMASLGAVALGRRRTT